MNIRAGIDLGGTKIEIVALNNKNEQIYQKRIATPQGNYQATLNAISSLVLDLEKNLKATVSVGIGTPGAFSTVTEKLKNANSTCLNDQNIQQDLETLLKRPIKISNDANCFTLSETFNGAAKNSQNVFGVIIGTGTGAGIVIDKKIVNGINNIAGEWGHNPLPWPKEAELLSTKCYCGKNGCIETFLSGPGMQADYYRLTNKKLESKEIVIAANKNDPDAENCLQRYEDRMARALAHIINILDPEIIVLGGGMSNIERLYVNIPERWTEYVFSDEVLTKLLPAKFGDASGVRGAACLWP